MKGGQRRPEISYRFTYKTWEAVDRISRRDADINYQTDEIKIPPSLNRNIMKYSCNNACCEKPNNEHN